MCRCRESFHFIYWGWEIENKFSESKLLRVRRFIRKLVPETLLLDVPGWALQFDWKMMNYVRLTRLILSFLILLHEWILSCLASPAPRRLFNEISDFFPTSSLLGVRRSCIWRNKNSKHVPCCSLYPNIPSYFWIKRIPFELLSVFYRVWHLTSAYDDCEASVHKWNK